jgi:hypothetical protein
MPSRKRKAVRQPTGAGGPLRCEPLSEITRVKADISVASVEI